MDGEERTSVDMGLWTTESALGCWRGYSGQWTGGDRSTAYRTEQAAEAAARDIDSERPRSSITCSPGTGTTMHSTSRPGKGFDGTVQWRMCRGMYAAAHL